MSISRIPAALPPIPDATTDLQNWLSDTETTDPLRRMQMVMTDYSSAQNRLLTEYGKMVDHINAELAELAGYMEQANAGAANAALECTFLQGSNRPDSVTKEQAYAFKERLVWAGFNRDWIEVSPPVPNTDIGWAVVVPKDKLQAALKNMELNSGTLTSEVQKLQTKVQTEMGRYTGSLTQATSANEKNENLGATIANNLAKR